MHCERIEITQAHRPGGITPRRGLLLPCRVGAVGLVYAVGRSVGRCTAFLCCRRVVCTLAPFRAFCGLFVGLWAWRCAAALPSYLKRIFTDFFKESETEHRPSEVLRFVCKLSTSIQQNQHHQRRTGGTAYTSKTSHSKPRQDSTSEDNTARNGAEPPTQRKHKRFYYTFSSEFFRFSRVGTISPGLTLCGTVALCH